MMWMPRTGSPVLVWRTRSNGPSRVAAIGALQITSDAAIRMSGPYPGPAAAPGANCSSENRPVWHRHPGGAGVRCGPEVHRGRPERILRRCPVNDRRSLHARGTADPDAGELGRVIHAQIVRQAGGRGIHEDNQTFSTGGVPAYAAPESSRRTL